MIKVEGLNYKIKGSDFKLRDISFKLPDGYMMALLGKNGSGKTTFLKCLYGLTLPNSGKVLWDDKIVVSESTKDYLKSVHEYHSDVAFVTGNEWCYENLTIDENVNLLGKLYKNFDTDELNKILKVFEFRKADRSNKISALSTGQKIQFEIAFALARHPKLVLMDEPFANLDPIIKMDIIDVIKSRMDNNNMSVIISTHLIEEINDITDYVGFIKNGAMELFGDRDYVLDDNNGKLRELFIKEGGEE